jgi:NADPH-dependent 2,4-dienoyl-CoA reductase/sulfur reductase-like enzyme
MRERPAVIVGAGPAGMAAAITLAEHGIRPTVIDENPRPGGQIYRQPPLALEPHPAAIGDSALLCRFRDLQDRVDILLETTVWGLFPPRRLAVVRTGHCQVIEAQHLVLAPGAYEYVPPFPGWTLPGVMTPGAAQALIKGMRVLPGKRALVAGTGPFLLVVADQLQRGGMDVAGVVELAPLWETVRAAPGLMMHPRLLWQGLRYLCRLRWKGVPIYRGHVLIEARGQNEVHEAVFGPCDDHGHPDRLRTRTVSVDTVCAGYGFVPRIQLAQLAGCRLRFEEPLGGWVPEVDEDLQTSVPGIWVAGDGGGVSGALAAELEGTLVGLGVACRLGALDERALARKRRPIRRRLMNLRRFRAALDGLFRLRSGLTALARGDTVVCRCEELTRTEVEEGIAAGGTDLRTLKVITRLGMGPCQGLMCWPATARLIADRARLPLATVGPLSVRPPIVPIVMGDLLDDHESGVGSEGQRSLDP